LTPYAKVKTVPELEKDITLITIDSVKETKSVEATPERTKEADLIPEEILWSQKRA